MAEQKPNKHLDKPTSTANSLPPGVQVDGRITPTKQEGRVTPTVPQAPPITIGQIISLISDAELLIDCVSMHKIVKCQLLLVHLPCFPKIVKCQLLLVHLPCFPS